MSDFLSAGRLEDHPFAVLSGLLFQENRTGELIIESGTARRTVWFLGGNPVAVVSDDPQDHLAQFLLEHGKISADDARRLADLPETREALGSADFLPKETLNWGVKSRFVNLCYDLFRWGEGDYGFREGEPPRELFLLKVPAHSLIFKGVGLMSQASLVDAVPDDATCGPGPVATAGARYLSPEAHKLLEDCRPGRTVTDALGANAGDPDSTRRLLYALSCLGLVSLSHNPSAAVSEIGEPETTPEFFLDDGDGPDFTATVAPPPPGEQRGSGGLLPDDLHASGDFALDLQPLGAEYDSPAASGSDFDLTPPSSMPGSHPFDDAPGSFGSFEQNETLDTRDELSATPEGEQEALDKKKNHAGRRFHLPRIVGIGLGSLAAVGIIAFAGWWWMSGSEPPAPPVKPPIKRPAPADVPAVTVPATAPMPAAVAPVPNPPVNAPAPAPVVTSTPPPAAPTVPAAVVVARPAAPEPAPRASAPTPRPAGVSPGAGGADRYRTALDIFKSGDLDAAAATWEALLAEQHRGAFTVQMLTACQHDTVRDAQRSLGSQELYLVTKKVNGRVCYRICLGTFESREAASRALAALPAAYRTDGAVRSVADVLNRDR